MGESLIIYGPPRSHRIAQNAHFGTLGPIYEKLVIIYCIPRTKYYGGYYGIVTRPRPHFIVYTIT